MNLVSDQWEIIGYEVKMFNWTYNKLNSRSFAQLPYGLKNAIEESAVLHTRILCEIFTNEKPTKPDDITLSKLLGGWLVDPKYDTIKKMTAKLAEQYGKNQKPDARWVFNKMMAHPTSHRGREYDYADILTALRPLIYDIVREIERLRKVRFPLRFVGPSRPEVTSIASEHTVALGLSAQGSGRAILDWLKANRLPDHARRSAEEIDADIEAERRSWD